MVIFKVMNLKGPAMNVQSTRRSFLGTTSAALAAFAIPQPQKALGIAEKERIKVGLVGLGGRGSMIAGMLKEHGGYEIAGLADYFPDVSKRAAARLGVPENMAFGGLSAYRRLLDSGVEAVVLKTPPYFFPQHAAAAVDAGIHVYVAKPVAVDVPGCLTIRKLGETSTRNRKVFHVDFQWRYLTHFVECIKHIRDGKMGDIRFVRAFYNDEGREDRAVHNISELFQGLRWAMSRELGGDRIVSAGIHAIDTALIVIGAHPTSACGVVQRSRKMPVNSATDTASLTYSFPGGVTMNYSGDQFRNFHHEIDMFSGVKAYADSAHADILWQGHDLHAEHRLALRRW